MTWMINMDGGGKGIFGGGVDNGMDGDDTVGVRYIILIMMIVVLSKHYHP